LLLVISVYVILFFASDQLRGKVWADEMSFFETSSQFSQRLFPTLDQLRSYEELNTPLPFIIYGQIRYLFQDDMFVGRFLNFILSITISFIIGWPGKNKSLKPLLALTGLLVFPYFLLYSTLYYTDIIAVFFVLLGTLLYIRERHVLSGVAFMLGIASRQYMLAFPLAIAAHELTISIRDQRRPSLSFFLPTISALSIFGWFILFGGLAPSAALDSELIPDVQKSLWNLTPHSTLYFLACIGLSYVIPEFFLFYRSFNWRKLFTIRRLIIAGSLLAVFIIFPPYLMGKGTLWKISEALPFDVLSPPLFYVLALITCWRFSQINLSFWLLAFNALIMMKAFPWDKYALPLIVILWYLRSNDRDFITLKSEERKAPLENPLQ
jgi:hypothetical protein